MLGSSTLTGSFQWNASEAKQDFVSNRGVSTWISFGHLFNKVPTLELVMYLSASRPSDYFRSFSQ